MLIKDVRCRKCVQTEIEVGAVLLECLSILTIKTRCWSWSRRNICRYHAMDRMSGTDPETTQSNQEKGRICTKKTYSSANIVKDKDTVSCNCKKPGHVKARTVGQHNLQIQHHKEESGLMVKFACSQAVGICRPYARDTADPMLGTQQTLC